MKRKCVLITGGAGFIGSHVNKMLHRAGYDTVIIDNLSRGDRRAVQEGVFFEGNISDASLLDRIFTSYSIDCVMHFAGLIDVGESVKEPFLYYTNNVSHTVNLLASMQKNSVKTLIFSSTAAIFGLPQADYITENHPQSPINPYGRSKLMVENILRDADAAFGIRSCCLRYFNAAGGDPEGQLKNYKIKESNLIPILLRSIQTQKGHVTIFGTDYPTPDGTCVRDYVHIDDLGGAHISAMEKLLSGAPSTCYNLGNGKGYSVREVITATEKILKCTINKVEGPRRPGDPACLVASSEKARRELDWQPRFSSLESIITHAWQAMQ